MQIDPEQLGKLPKVGAPTPFTGVDGSIRGWRLKIPGGRPLATPAVVNGRVFLGGGFGSYEFYAVDAETGHVLWQHQTTDDGPTAAVVEDDYVVFNTESCELEVLTWDGEAVWKHWLGDPLMSMPAVADGHVFMAYPDTRGDGEHYLACFELGTGRLQWKQRIAGDIITAPVLADGEVYLATLDGTLYCFCQDDGQLKWQEASNATSSPVVVAGKCFLSRRQLVTAECGRGEVQQTEHCAWRAVTPGAETRAYQSTSRKADYLDHGKRRARSPLYAFSASSDAGVGFAFSKGSAKMHQAMRNLGRGSVLGVWSYQGSKPFFSKGRLYSSAGDTVRCVDTGTEDTIWKCHLKGSDSAEELLDSVLTPPVLVNDKVVVGMTTGEVVALAADSGETLWRINVGESIDFQPAVAHGRVYAPTRQGSLFCLETGDAADDGWLMWGATPAHNGLPEPDEPKLAKEPSDLPRRSEREAPVVTG